MYDVLPAILAAAVVALVVHVAPGSWAWIAIGSSVVGLLRSHEVRRILVRVLHDPLAVMLATCWLAALVMGLSQ